jgi:hypothetical protein
MLFTSRRLNALRFLALNLFIRRFFGVPDTGQTFRIIATEKSNEPLAHVATKIENFARVSAADEGAHFDCALLRIGHLQSADFPIPFRVVLNEPLQFFAQFANGRLIIEVQNDRAEQIGRNATPVLKRFFDKVGDRQNHPAQIPRPHSYVRESDFFDLAKLAFDHHDVIDE